MVRQSGRQMTFSAWCEAMRKAGAVAAVGLCVTQAEAQSPSAVYVMGESEDSPGIKECSLSYSSATSAIEAALRYNGVKLATEQQVLADEAIRAYVNINALHEARGCFASVKLAFDTIQIVPLPITLKMGDSIVGTVRFCERETVMSGPTYDFQARINQWLRDSTDVCISVISRMKRL